MPDLLYEIGVEEIPAGYIKPAIQQLETAMLRELAAANLDHGDVHVTATPRRLVIVVANVSDRQPDMEQEVSGPPVKAAFDADGNPTKAALGFAQSQGVDVADIQQRETERGLYCFVRKNVIGRPAVEILSAILPKITRQISSPKSMLWPGGEGPFARPVRWLLALFGNDAISFTIFGLASGRTTEGHPILDPGRFEIATADLADYRESLRQRSIIVDMEERTEFVKAGLETVLNDMGGILAPEALEADLIGEVVNLVQYPSVTLGTFHPDFLKVPPSVIKAAMMEHQRYFPILATDSGHELSPHFVVVSDRGPEPSDKIRVGNEEVLGARLADARFFYEQDGKTPLADRVAGLSGVAFLKGLGSYAEKAARLETLSRHVAEALELDEAIPDSVARAAQLCKGDLLTEMVGEFPKLQGEVGRIYALRDGESETVAMAIAEHYLPRSADGALPTTPAGNALSLTEKIDNLVSCFALGLIPTGSADPYALRRQSQGAARIIEASGRHLRLSALFEKALALLPEPHNQNSEAISKLMDFVRDRVFQMALDRGAPHDLINAALGVGFDDLLDFWMRLDALRTLATEASWQPLVVAVERTANISRDAVADETVNPAAFTEALEKELWGLVEAHEDDILRLEKERKYVEASQRYAEVFSTTLHQFFEDVFVNVDDLDVRNHRLQLLRRINALYTERIADLSQIVTGVHTHG